MKKKESESPDESRSDPDAYFELVPVSNTPLKRCVQMTVRMTFESATVLIQLGVN